jgi:hypothetical protein
MGAVHVDRLSSVARRAWLLLLIAAGVAVAGCETHGLMVRRVAAVNTRRSTNTSLVVYAGYTTQRAELELQLDRSRSVVTALRFSISYSCMRRRGMTLHALVLRPDYSWAIVDRSPLAAPGAQLGFSDWFGGPVGHVFHVTGTLSADATAVTGTLHSVLRVGRSRCDSGHLDYRADLTRTALPLPRPVEITRNQYRRLPTGTTVAVAERALGAPNDRDVFQPTGIIAGTLPSGIPGADQTWLDYLWRGHRHRYFQFFFRAGRLIAGEAGRSIAIR